MGTKMEFSELSIDRKVVYDHIKDEMHDIFDSPKARRGRSLKEVETACMTGGFCEVYLMQTHGYTKNHKKYHDLISPEGIETEVKARHSYTESPESIVKTCKTYNAAKRYIFFKVKNGYYTLEKQIDL